jgi:hypothetical protein
MKRKPTAFRRAMAVYARLEHRLLPKHDGEFVAVEPVSGDYVVGPDEVKVAKRAMRRHPNALLEMFRVGRPFVHHLRTGSRVDHRSDRRKR